MQKWEYLIWYDEKSGEIDYGTLQRLGEEGWDLIAIIPTELYTKYTSKLTEYPLNLTDKYSTDLTGSKSIPLLKYYFKRLLLSG